MIFGIFSTQEPDLPSSRSVLPIPFLPGKGKLGGLLLQPVLGTVVVVVGADEVG